MNCSMPGLPVHHQLPEFTQTHVHRVSDAIQPSYPLSSPSLLPPTPPSIRAFSNESTLRMTWPKYWSFSFSIIPFKEIPGLISFRMDWLDLLTVQGTLKSLPQHHSSKASILRCSAFFTVQLSYPHMTTGKTIALTRWTFFWQSMVKSQFFSEPFSLGCDINDASKAFPHSLSEKEKCNRDCFGNTCPWLILVYPIRTIGGIFPVSSPGYALGYKSHESMLS